MRLGAPHADESRHRVDGLELTLEMFAEGLNEAMNETCPKSEGGAARINPRTRSSSPKSGVGCRYTVQVVLWVAMALLGTGGQLLHIKIKKKGA